MASDTRDDRPAEGEAGPGEPTPTDTSAGTGTATETGPHAAADAVPLPVADADADADAVPVAVEVAGGDADAAEEPASAAVPAADASSTAAADDDDDEIPLDEEAIEELEADDLLIDEDEDAGEAGQEPGLAAAPPAAEPPPTPPRRAPTATRPPPPPTRPLTSGIPGEAAGADAADPGDPPDAAIAAPIGAAEVDGEPPAASPDQPSPTDGDPLAAPLESPTALDRLVDAERGSSREAQAEALTRELEGSSSKDRVGALAYELGELCERQLGDEARAVKAFGRALQADPSLRSNLWAIRRVFYRRGLWPNLVKLIGAETRFAPDDAARADLLVEKGAILEDHVGDTEEAVAAYQQAVEIDPRCLPALLGLERIALRRGDHASLERTWQLLAEASDSPRRAQAYYLDLVQLFGERGGDSLDRARAFMERAIELGGVSDRLARMREWLAEQSGDPAELLAALDARAAELMSRFGPAGPPDSHTAEARDAGAPGPGDADGDDDGHDIDMNTEDPRTAEVERGAAGPVGEAAQVLRRRVIALRRRQARIAAHRLNDSERAWSYLQLATALSPSEPLLVADLADMAERLGKYDELAELVEGWESQEADPSRALSLALRRADALFRGGHDEAARAVLATLSATQPGYLPVLALRERDALVSLDRTALAETYVAAADAARAGQGFGPGAPGQPDPAAAAGYALAAGDLYLHVIRTPEVARGRYAQALEMQPGYPAAVEALAALHEQAGRLDDAAALYELHSESGEGGYRLHVLERLVDLYGRMDRPEEVEGALVRLCALQPEDASLRWRLEEVQGALGKPRERAATLLELARMLDDPDRRAAALLEAARLLDAELGDPAGAIPLYREVLEAWPADRYARQAMAVALRRTGRWEDLVAARRAEAGELDDAAAARALREAVAILLDRLDRPADAVEVARDLVDRAPTDPDAHRLLAEALARVGDATGALEVLEREAEVRGDGPGADEVNCRIAALAETLGRPGEAEEAYGRALAARPDSARAAVGQLELAARRGDAGAEAAALIRLAEAPVAAAVAAELCERAGWLTALSGGDGIGADGGRGEEAVRLFERALELEPGRRGALLGRLLVEARTGDPFALGDALGELAAATPGSYAAASLHLRAAVIAEVQGDEQGVGERIGRALAAAPGDAGTLVTVAEYLPPPGPATSAGAGADEITRRAALIAARAQLAGDPASQHDWRLGQAELLESLGRLTDALGLIGQVLRARPDDIRGLQLLRRICRRGGDRDALARASAQLARVIGDPEGKLELLREAVTIFDHELGEIDAAVPVYRRILAEDPAAGEFDRLHEILRDAGDQAGLYEVLSQRIHHLDADLGDEAGPARSEQLADHLLKRAAVRAELGDDRGAARDLATALEHAPRHPDGLLRRGEALHRMGQHDEAASCYERFLELAGDDPRRPAAELALSEILAENMDDLAGAIVQLEHVARQAPDDVSLRERLIDLMLRAGEHRRASEELRQLERLRTGAAEKARDLLRLARLLRDHVGDPSGAAAALERARQLEPLSTEPLRQLIELLPEESARRAELLGGAAGDLRQAIAEDPSRTALYERLAAVAQWQEDDDARALALQAQEALGSIPAEQKKFLAGWTAGAGAAIDLDRAPDPLHPSDWARLVDPSAGGFAAELWALLAPAVAAALPGDPGQIGFARGDRLRGKDLERAFPAVLAALRLFGGEELDVYVSRERTRTARVVAGERRALFLGADVAAPATAEARFMLGRAAALVREGTGPLADLDDAELAGWFAAAAELAEVPAPEPVARRTEGRRQTDRARHLGKQLGRRERRQLAGLGPQFAELGDPGAWRRAALRAGARAGLLLSGDLAAALAVLDVGRGARSLADDPSALSLVAWAVSSDHLHLRRRLRT